MKPVFLSAAWKDLVMANYSVDPAILLPFLPSKTELDYFSGQCYVSLVAFQFVNVRLRGLKIPFHVNFPEVNLRFYVRHWDGDTWKRGVVFIREIVPRPAITFIANYIYRENYSTALMRSYKEVNAGEMKIEHRWKWKGRWSKLSVLADAAATPIIEASKEEFITEHYWGYARWNGEQTNEYQVEHPRWRTHAVQKAEIDADFSLLYGPAFRLLSTQEPDSVFVADGSDIIIRSKNILL